MLTGILLAAVIVIISRKFDLLTNNGTFLAFILGSLIFGLGGLPWSIPIILFFTSSSLLTKLRERLNKESLEYFIKGSRRDYKQVLSNGGLGGLLVVFYTLTNNE